MKPYSAFATAHPGLEPVLAEELAGLGFRSPVVEPGGVGFETDLAGIARANLGLRTAGRVIVRVATFHASAFHELERHARKIDWPRFLGPGAAAHFRVTTRKSKLYHERAIVERLGSAVSAGVSGASVIARRDEAEDEDESVVDLPVVQRFIVRFQHDECVISADTSGPLLHRRGYRQAVARAPLRETLAAGFLLSAGYDGREPLIDPMCGSGTIPIEAALLARRQAPGLLRRFAFERWPGTESAVTAGVRDELRHRERSPGFPIRGSDRDAGAVAAAEQNGARAGVEVEWRQAPVSAMDLEGDPGLVATNPPWGHRVGERAALRNLYAQLGNVLRRRGVGWRLAIVGSDRMLEGQIGVGFEERCATESGGLRIRFLAGRVAALPERLARPGGHRRGGRSRRPSR
ncbi:MAG: class I SAM-dependent RNA methyltransferase [Gemmatimonadales bacterium]